MPVKARRAGPDNFGRGINTSLTFSPILAQACSRASPERKDDHASNRRRGVTITDLRQTSHEGAIVVAKRLFEVQYPNIVSIRKLLQIPPSRGPAPPEKPI
ncbi:MAG: hypothetical protein WC600_01165 [Desulfobaccales bacterium]